MAKAPTSDDEIVLQNLKNFRAEAKLTQEDAAQLSGVPIDNLRRYENGKTQKIPGAVLKSLAEIYGHTVEHFFQEKPPAADFSNVPKFYLKSHPAVVADESTIANVESAIAEGNTRRGKKPVPLKARK